MNFEQPYNAARSAVCAKNVVATSQPLATQAGIRAMMNGGNAVDAALAAAITLTVVEPCMNGVGSDAFTIIWDGNKLHGLNGSGKSPAGWTPEYFAGHKTMPGLGWDSVTVPGAVSVWVEVSNRFGELPFEALFEDAIGYARNGFHVGPVSSEIWQMAPQMYPGFEDFAEQFLPAPKPGELFVREALATARVKLETATDASDSTSAGREECCVPIVKAPGRERFAVLLGRVEHHLDDPLNFPTRLRQTRDILS